MIFNQASFYSNMRINVSVCVNMSLQKVSVLECGGLPSGKSDIS